MNLEIKKIPFKDYHIIANTLLKEHGLLDCKNIPIDIELLIDKMNINIIPLKNIKKEYGVRGLVIKKVQGFDIGIDEDHWMDERNELYFRFTLAEELSHIILHSNIFNNINGIDSYIKLIKNISDDDYKNMEQQARVLAGCLLLPAHLFDDYVLKYVEIDLENIKKYKFIEKEELSYHIADKIHKSLKLSIHVVFKIINKRYPNLLIDKILDNFGIYNLLG